MQEIRRPIQGIDDPDRLVVPCLPAFLRQEGVMGIMFADDGDDLRLRLRIDLADEVVAAFGRDRKGLQAVQTADNDFAGAARGADGDIEKRVHGK